MNWPVHTTFLVLWFSFGLVGIFPPYFLFVPSPFFSYAWPLSWLHGPNVNHHSGFPLMYVRNVIGAANGSLTFEYDYWRLTFDIGFVGVSTACLYVVLKRHRQFSIRLLFGITCMAGVLLGLYHHLEGRAAIIVAVLYSLPTLYCGGSAIKSVNCST